MRKDRPQFIFNPYELALCGFRNSGKTTLITRLIEMQSGDHAAAYVKHDGHAFDIDREGKDTKRAADAGAHAVWINDGTHSARIDFKVAEKFDRMMAMQEADFVFIEGYKRAGVEKIVVLDDGGAIRDEGLENVIAQAGAGHRAPEYAYPEVPYFCRDDVEAINEFIMARWTAQAEATPLNGLVLAGGKSTRMQRDKSELNYHGVSQARFVHDLVAPHVATAYVSARADQAEDADKKALPLIHDVYLGMGPTGGLLSAMHVDPGAAWLVIACDLPYLERLTIETLLSGRNPFKVATAFISAHDGFPEPLCAVYEPKARYRLHQFVGLGYNCPRKAMINSNVQLLQQKNPKWLDNVNTPEEFEAAITEIGKGRSASPDGRTLTRD